MAFHSDVLCDKANVWHASAVNYCIIVEQIFENMFKLKCYDTAQEDGGLICKKMAFQLCNRSDRGLHVSVIRFS